MKLNGFVGKGSGKLGASVFAISGGEQIVRQYNPQVTNPNTDAQIAQRAKFKLLSQIAADLKDVLALKKVGLVSKSNRFVSLNFPLVTYSDRNATVQMTRLQISEGEKAQGSISITSGEDNFTVQVIGMLNSGVTKAAVVVLRVGNDNQIKATSASVVALEGGTSRELFVPNDEGDIVVLAYGIKENVAQEGVGYEDYEAEIGDNLAALAAFIRSSASNGAFTTTIGGRNLD